MPSHSNVSGVIAHYNESLLVYILIVCLAESQLLYASSTLWSVGCTTSALCNKFILTTSFASFGMKVGPGSTLRGPLVNATKDAV